MTTKIVAGVVDVVVLRRVGRAWRVLTLQRAAGVRSTGAWEIVHGSIEPRETPVQAALRELREETGFAPERLYSITTNPFYLSRSDTIQVAVAFAAVVTSAKFTLGVEHSRAKWETLLRRGSGSPGREPTICSGRWRGSSGAEMLAQ